MSLYSDAKTIWENAIKAALPDQAVQKELMNLDLGAKKKVLLVAIGKAAWQMSKAALETLGDKITDGIVITKYDHNLGELPGLKVYEAGHPVLDQATIEATDQALKLTKNLTSDDVVLFLVSGGGSALFEKPQIELSELQDITEQMLAQGSDIVELNTIRKRLSLVKGGKFAKHCAPAQIKTIVLSDIIGDPLDMIASGPAYPDSSTSADAFAIQEKYGLVLSKKAEKSLAQETPKVLDNVNTVVIGSVSQLCNSAKETAEKLGYTAQILTSSLSCIAREAGSFLASVAEYYQTTNKSLAFILGGETVVEITGVGKGGRNQEIALAASKIIAKCKQTCLFSIGSDGTDGPTDAAGGYVDTDTLAKLQEKAIEPRSVLDNNDSHRALKAVGGLIVTGPTGTNVNDLTVLLIKR